MKESKDKLRNKMKSLRQEELGNREQTAEKAAQNFLSKFDFPPSSVIAGYWAMNTELPTVPLLIMLHKKGYTCCLPITHADQKPLSFRIWTPETVMIPGYHGILVPQEGKEIEPDVLVMPLLAFTNAGERLGFGKGHYDYTLEKLRAKKHVTAIGYAYAKQEVDSLPQDQYDQKLNWIVTDQTVIKGNP